MSFVFKLKTLKNDKPYTRNQRKIIRGSVLHLKDIESDFVFFFSKHGNTRYFILFCFLPFFSSVVRFDADFLIS